MGRLCLLFVFGLLAFCSSLASSKRSDMRCPPSDSIPNCYCMKGSYLFRGPFVTCSHLSSLEELTQSLSGLKGNPIEALQLYNVSISSFPRDGLFQDMHIEYLWLASSNFESFAPRGLSGPSPFAGLENSVEHLKLDWLLNFEYGDWQELGVLKKLRNIDVYTCNMNSIEVNFSKVPKSVQYIDIFLGSVNRVDPAAFAFDNLTSLTLMGNKIQTLSRDIFAPTAGNLSYVMLSLNQLMELPANFFEGMPALKFADIGRNNLTSLPSSLKTIWNQLESVYLAGNPFNCNCDLVWLLRAMQNKKAGNDFDFITCDAPSRLHNKKLNTLQESDLCP